MVHSNPIPTETPNEVAMLLFDNTSIEGFLGKKAGKTRLGLGFGR